MGVLLPIIATRQDVSVRKSAAKAARPDKFDEISNLSVMPKNRVGIPQLDPAMGPCCAELGFTTKELSEKREGPKIPVSDLTGAPYSLHKILLERKKHKKNRI